MSSLIEPRATEPKGQEVPRFGMEPSQCLGADPVVFGEISRENARDSWDEDPSVRPIKRVSHLRANW